MLQQKTNRKQKKFFQKIKILSLLFSLLILLGILDLVYISLKKQKSPYINPLQTVGGSELAQDLEKRGVEFEDIEEGSNFYVLKLNSGETVILSKNKDVLEQLSSLQLILSRFKIEGKVIKNLDFRFSQPVVK